MNYGKLVTSLMAGVLLLAEPSVTHGQGNLDYAQIKAEHTEAVTSIANKADKQRADMFDKYAAALEAPVKEATAKGKLEVVLAIKKEQEIARKERKPGTAPIPEISGYRALLEKTIAGIQSKASLDTAALNSAYSRKLDILKSALTRANRIDDAVAVDSEMKTLQGQAVDGNLPTELGVRIDGGAPIMTSVVALVGLHKPKSKVQVGGEDPTDKKKPEVHGYVTTRPGTVLDDGDLYVQEGEWKAEGTLFRRCKLSADLGGAWTIKGSLLDDCSMGKAGGWHVSLFTSHWSFDNCAFSRGFMSKFETHDVGVKATHCTFHDVDFVSVKYKDDTGKEAADQWMTFSDCKFINCKVPETLLVATKDCVFEDCRFEPEKDGLPGDTAVKVKLYAPPLTTLPSGQKHVTYDLHNPSERTTPAGATIRYSRAGRNLQF